MFSSIYTENVLYMYWKHIYIYMFSVHIQYLRWQIAYYCKLNHKVAMRATFNQTPHWRCCDLWEWKWMSRWPREIQNKNLNETLCMLEESYIRVFPRFRKHLKGIKCNSTGICRYVFGIHKFAFLFLVQYRLFLVQNFISSDHHDRKTYF